MTEELQPVLETCDSCGKNAELIEVSHHQAGNKAVWHYCQDCKMAHDKEVAITNALKELAKTHSVAVNRSDVLNMLKEGKSVEEIKKFLDTTKQPELEAEVVG